MRTTLVMKLSFVCSKLQPEYRSEILRLWPKVLYAGNVF